MLNDLDETLKQLLVQKGGQDPAEVAISFNIRPATGRSTRLGARRSR